MASVDKTEDEDKLLASDIQNIIIEFTKQLYAEQQTTQKLNDGSLVFLVCPVNKGEQAQQRMRDTRRGGVSMRVVLANTSVDEMGRRLIRMMISVLSQIVQLRRETPCLCL